MTALSRTPAITQIIQEICHASPTKLQKKYIAVTIAQ